MTLLIAITSQAQPRAEREASAAEIDANDPRAAAVALGLTVDAAGYLMALNRRASAQTAWRSFFEEWDILVCPTALDAAFPHQSGEQAERTLDIDGRAVPYQLNIVYPM